MNNYHYKYFNYIYNYISKLKKPIILELGVGDGITTSIFLKSLKKSKGQLYSVDNRDCSSLFNNKSWHFIQSRDDNFSSVIKTINKKIDVILLDTEHNPFHIEKVFYNYFPILKRGGYFLIDGISWLPYVKGNYRDHFISEVTNYESFNKILDIYYSNTKNVDLEFSFIGSGIAKIIKKKNNINIPIYFHRRTLSLVNFIRVIKNKIKSL